MTSERKVDFQAVTWSMTVLKKLHHPAVILTAVPARRLVHPHPTSLPISRPRMWASNTGTRFLLRQTGTSSLVKLSWAVFGNGLALYWKSMRDSSRWSSIRRTQPISSTASIMLCLEDLGPPIPRSRDASLCA